MYHRGWQIECYNGYYVKLITQIDRLNTHPEWNQVSIKKLWSNHLNIIW